MRISGRPPYSSLARTHRCGSRGWSRRDALRVLGLGGFGAVSALRPDMAESFPLQGRKIAQPASQRRAIIRTVLKDVQPDSITGVTLIHEHLSMHAIPPAPTFYDDVGLIADEVGACARDGVSCIVDTGGQDLGRRIDDLRTIATRSGC